MSFGQQFNKASLVFGESLAIASFVRKYFVDKARVLQAKDSALRLANDALNYNNIDHAEIQENASALVKTNQNPYRPSQWDRKDLVYAKTSLGGYFFDAVLKIDHTSTVRITEHPVQNGANTSDHAFKLPDRVVLEIGMSDCMDSYIKDQYTSEKSKSISAYRKLKELQASFTVMELTTRLYNYKNMLIEQITAPDDFKTLNGLKCSITLKELKTSEVDVILVSARPQVTTKPRATVVQPVQADSTIAAKIEQSSTGSTKFELKKSH